MGAPLPAFEDLDWVIGPPLLDSLRQLLGKREGAEQCLAHYRERFSVKGLYENSVYEGIPDALGALSARGAQMYVATSKPTVYARQIVEHFGLDVHLIRVHGSELDGTRSRKGELIHHVLQEESLDPSCTVMIGDREHDVIGARENALPCLGVLYGYGSVAELRAAGATALVKSPADIPDGLNRMF
jgi:phosphoglycolate phosphatase